MRRKPWFDLGPLSRAHAVASGIALAAGVAGFFAACSDPHPEVIAQFQDDAATTDSGGDAAGTTGTAGEAGAGGASGAHAGGFVVPPQRGRVKVVDGNLVSDLGTPLRGMLLPVDSTWSPTSFDFDTIKSYAQGSGLNTLHLYLENSSVTTGMYELAADYLVSMAAQNGLYVIIGFGTGMAVGKFEQTPLTNFWSLYAKRYADQTHVLFEIQNNPESTCNTAFAAATLTMEHKVYNQVRGLAPDSHVLLLSSTGLLTPNVLQAAITDLSSDVDWTNASIVMDDTPGQSPPCQQTIANLSALTSAAKAQGVPLLIGELPPTDWGPSISAFEAAHLGWMQYTYFADATQRTLSALVSATKAAGVTWCPDQGTFPQDSQSCH